MYRTKHYILTELNEPISDDRIKEWYVIPTNPVIAKDVIISPTPSPITIVTLKVLDPLPSPPFFWKTEISTPGAGVYTVLRYASLAEALDGHQRAVEDIEAGLHPSTT